MNRLLKSNQIESNKLRWNEIEYEMQMSFIELKSIESAFVLLLMMMKRKRKRLDMYDLYVYNNEVRK
jgi:hypothetical protein